jgi:predicted DNA-binding protein YlxM (UPF0122 family)
VAGKLEPSRFDVPQDALYDEEFRKLLTAREEEFLVLRLGTHLSWRLIANELGITPRTIYDYARQVSRKWTHYQNKGVSA